MNSRRTATLACMFVAGAALAGCETRPRYSAADVIGLPIPPPPARYVTDGADLLSQESEAALESRLTEHERTTGQQVIVWIGRSLEGSSLEDWCVRAFEAWGVGRKGRDDGAALFVFADDHKARIEVGYGLEPVLTDVTAGRILDEKLIPAMRANAAERGITDAVNAMLQFAGREVAGAPRDVPKDRAMPPPGRRPGEVTERPVSPLREIFGVLFFIAMIFLVVRHPWIALFFLSNMGRGGRGGFGGGGFGDGGLGGGGGFSGGGGHSGGGGASRSW